MTSRPRVARSIPFWVLFAGSLVATAGGAWISFSKLGTMIAGLTAQTATTAEVYGGQSWIVLGAALLGAGLIGLIAVLALAVVGSLLSPAAATVEAVDDVAVAGDDLPFVEVAPVGAAAPAAPTAVASDAPVIETAAEAPVADETDAEPAPADPYASDFETPAETGATRS